jgi:choline dehydrogenase
VHDYVIVGAGSAGCVLAARLTEDPAVSVLLLEAGPPDRKLEIKVPAAFSKLFDSAVDWGYRTAPQDGLGGREVFFPRGKVVGGSSSINAMMALRGHCLDQDAWGLPGWDWADVEGLYARSGSGPFTVGALRRPHPLTLAFLDAAAAAGIPRSRDLNAPDNDGVGLTPVSQRRGRRWSVADGYLKPARRRSNLTLVTGALVTRILLDGTRAVGVAYRSNGTPEEARAAREIVLAAGAIDTPKLLMLSGIGPREQLESVGVEVALDAPAVGRNLLDHLANGILVATEGIETLATAERPRHLAAWVLRRSGPLASNVAEAAAFVRTDPGLSAPNLELIFAPVPFEQEGLQPPSRHGFTIASVLLQPRSVGEVRLRSADPAAAPVIDPRYLTDPEGQDAATLLHGIRLARRVAATEPLVRHVEAEFLPGEAAQDDEALRAHLRQSSQTLYHPVGTCAMGLDPGAVLDPALRVRGLDRLRVVDASAIPRLPRGHTNWPTVMLAERGAELIRSAG